MTPKTKKLLKWLDSGERLESQIAGSGLSAALNDALLDGYADMGAHSTVKERSGVPAAGVWITDKGRKALADT